MLLSKIAVQCSVTAHLQDSISSVGTDDGDDMQLFSDLCPQGLQRIHGATISLTAYILTVTPRTYTKAEPIFAQSHHNQTPAAHIFLEMNNLELADGCRSSFTCVTALYIPGY